MHFACDRGFYARASWVRWLNYATGNTCPLSLTTFLQYGLLRPFIRRALVALCNMQHLTTLTARPL